MIDDIERLKTSPCYEKLTESQKAIFDEAYDNFNYWVNESAFYRGGHSLTTLASTGASLASKYPATAPILSLGGWMNDNVGGRIVNTTVADVIVTYKQSFRTMKGVLRARGGQLNSPDCKGMPSGGGGGGSRQSDGDGGNNQTGNDPSGIVYEGVIENPVSGAAVTLYYAADGSGIMAANASSASTLILADGVQTLIPRQAVQTTGSDGRYQWGVPEGLWYVSAEYAGLRGNSNGDAAATAAVSGLSLKGQTVTNLLPVLPVQLDVNIPLVDHTPPIVDEVRFDADGITVTYSKYMEDSGAASVLSQDNYSLTDDTGAKTAVTVQAVEQGHTPSNLAGQTVNTFTKTVRLTPVSGGFVSKTVTLTVSDTVKSYAGVPMGTAYTDTLTKQGLNVTPGDGSLHYEFPFPTDGGMAYVVSVSCDANGRFLDSEIQTVRCNGLDSGSIPVLGSAAKYKLFVLDADFRPMSDCWSNG